VELAKCIVDPEQLGALLLGGHLHAREAALLERVDARPVLRSQRADARLALEAAQVQRGHGVARLRS
jgi:hypothetical protein